MDFFSSGVGGFIVRPRGRSNLHKDQDKSDIQFPGYCRIAD